MRAKSKFSKLDSCIGNAILVLLCTVFSPAMLYLGVSSVYDELNLRDNGVIVNAVVTDSRVEKVNNGEKYEVKYQFSIDSGNTWYSCSDRTGRHNLWCSVTEEQWRVTQSTKQVEVTYLPGKPWINRLVQSNPPPSMGDSLAGVFLGICPWVLYLIIRVANKKYGNAA